MLSPHAVRQWWTRARARRKASAWIRRGRVPGGRGYTAAKWAAVERALLFDGSGPFGVADAGLDERVVEYPWAFARLAALHTPGARILDAGSVTNHPATLAYCRRAGFTPLSIVTLRYEGYAEVSDDVRYEFADLRALPYRDGCFQIVLSLSTLEHVGMDNAGYGDSSGASVDPSAETARAVRELARVTAPGGTALISVPFGQRAHRGWLRVFDAQDLRVLTDAPEWRLDRSRFFRATPDGWRECAIGEVSAAGYNEPFSKHRPSIKTAPEWVAAAEAVALVELKKL